MKKAIHRLFEYLKHENIPHTRFEKDVGISNGYLKKQLEREAGLGEDIIVKIIEKSLHLNPDWLLRGKGKMLLNESAIPYKTKNFLVPITAQAGYVNEFSQDYSEKLIPMQIPGIEGEARTFEIAGGSMEPVLIEGDYVVCRRVEHESRLVFGDIYVIVSSSGITAKYILNRQDGLHCVPHNQEEYQGETIPREEVREVWQVIGKYTTNLTPHLYPGVYQKIHTKIERIEEILMNSKRIENS